MQSNNSIHSQGESHAKYTLRIIALVEEYEHTSLIHALHDILVKSLIHACM